MEVAALIAALQQPLAAERIEAARLLCQAGTGANSAAVALVQAVGDDDDDVRQWVTAALEELGPPRVEDLENLEQVLRESEADRAYWAATLIGRLGSAGGGAAKSLAAVARSAQPLTVRQQAVWAIGELGPVAHDCHDTLREVSASPDPRLRRLAEAALESTKKPPPNQR